MFEFIGLIFNAVLFQPLFNGLIFLYEYVPGKDFGVAIIILTALLRFVFYPLSAKAIQAQKKMAELQPKIKEIQEKFTKEEQAKAMLELYRREQVNPLASLLPIFAQLPILIALYQVFSKGLQAETMKFLYNFVPQPGTIDPTFLGLMNLAEKSWPMAIAAGLFQFIQTKQMALAAKPKDSSAMVQQQMMMYLFPAVTVFIVAQLPSAVGLYWIVSSLFSIFQQWVMTKNNQNAKRTA